MPKLFDITFVSSNIHKFEEAKQILSDFGISIGYANYSLEEIQSNSLKSIAIKKAKDAFFKLKKPVLIEDDGLYIPSLGGFPGPYSSYVFQTIGNDGILNLLKKIGMQNLFQLFLIVTKKIFKLLLEIFMVLFLFLNKVRDGDMIQFSFQKT